ncbi:SAM-dependent methyltransferase [Pontivivens ytuae]|uniref:SAM-dependent methyltransferase n=2 Tax=Pontivivens ytuae TaxID=2789856 RepID=A0A7S9LVK2_9RHOB|nr:SAM-dependent methyltransferase [Pontivivens ytuae]
MQAALQHPELGYYITRDPLGAGGDFTTAPEVHQIFGEMIGLWLAQVRMDRGPATLVELGPGRGTLMADILRVWRQLGLDADVILVETSPALRARQSETLGDVRWVDRVEDLPGGPLLLIANEFFDALPIRQFVRTQGRWAERVVGLDGETLAFGLKAPQPQPQLDRLFPATPEDTLVEWCPAAAPILQHLAPKLVAALLIDYGAWDGTGDTLQALHDHQPVGPLAAPGTADLTAHVNFSHLAAAAGLPHAFDTQGAFLERLGITARAQALASKDPGIAAAHRRLVHPGEMGTLFKVLALAPPGPALPGFAPG